MDISAILSKRFPEAQWSLSGDDYSGLEWFSSGDAPSLGALEKLWPGVEAEIARERVEQARAVAYRETSDAVFFEYQRGAKTEADWLAAVEAVKTAHPYPEA
jgi:hypothetical protein